MKTCIVCGSTFQPRDRHQVRCRATCERECMGCRRRFAPNAVRPRTRYCGRKCPVLCTERGRVMRRAKQIHTEAAYRSYILLAWELLDRHPDGFTRADVAALKGWTPRSGEVAIRRIRTILGVKLVREPQPGAPWVYRFTPRERALILRLEAAMRRTDAEAD